jgi:hypothetical protein
MPRAATKDELIVSANGQWEKMWKIINVLPVEPQTVRFDFDAPKLKEAHWTRDKNFVTIQSWWKYKTKKPI